jgi:3-hydroxybutyryl-CoA dehydratase
MADRRISQAEVDEYAEVSTDRNPLHVDLQFAAGSKFGATIVHGFLLLGDATHELQRSTTYPKRLHCEFLAPVHPGEPISTGLGPIDGNARSFEVCVATRICVTGTIEGVD